MATIAQGNSIGPVQQENYQRRAFLSACNDSQKTSAMYMLYVHSFAHYRAPRYAGVSSHTDHTTGLLLLPRERCVFDYCARYLYCGAAARAHT